MNITNEIRRIEQLLRDSNAKLANKKFLKKAPQNVIDKEKQKVNDFSITLDLLYQQKHQDVEQIKSKICSKYGNERWVEWLIQNQREWDMILLDNTEYTESWFSKVYAEITEDEILYIAEKLNL